MAIKMPPFPKTTFAPPAGSAKNTDLDVKGTPVATTAGSKAGSKGKGYDVKTKTMKMGRKGK